MLRPTDLAEEHPVGIRFGERVLCGSLSIPQSPHGVAIVASDRAACRHNETLVAVARALRNAGFATLMVDLLGADELADEETAASVRMHGVPLACRLHAAREWMRARPDLGALPVVYVGLGGGGTAALLEAAAHPRGVAGVAVDCRWPDVVGLALARVDVPVMFFADAGDEAALERTHRAVSRLHCPRTVAILTGDQAERGEQLGARAGAWLAARLSLRNHASAAHP